MDMSNSDEITSKQKQIILKYIKANNNILHDYAGHANIWTLLHGELQSANTNTTLEECVSGVKSWIASVERAFKTDSIKCAIEIELLKIIKAGNSNCFTNVELQSKEPTKPTANTMICCRICLKKYPEENVSSVFFYVETYTVSISEMIESCANVKIHSDDEMPKYICNDCLPLLVNAFKFKTLCEKSESEFKSNELKSLTADTELTDVEIKSVTCDENDLRDALDAETMNNDFHNSSDEQISSESIDQPNSINKQMQQQLMCDQCGITFSKSVDLRTHLKTHVKKSHSCIYCNKLFRTSLSLKIHVRIHTGERPYVCEICGKSFKTIGSIQNHQYTHINRKDFKCEFCTYETTTQANLKVHYRTHSGVKAYKCDICHLSFSTAGNKQKHIRNIHKKIRSHECKICGRFFFSLESAKKHKITHTGDKPYGCGECGTRYGWYNGLKKHMRSHHPNVVVPLEKSFLLDIMSNKSDIKCGSSKETTS